MKLDSLTLLALLVFEHTEAFEGGPASNELVGEVSLVVWVLVSAALVVHLVVRVLRFTCDATRVSIMELCGTRCW